MVQVPSARSGASYGQDPDRRLRSTALIGVSHYGTHGGNIRVILRLYEDNGKENGNYYIGVWGCRF